MTRPRTIPLAVLLSLVLPAVGHAERLPTKILTTADGLANNAVNRIVRDSHGYFWFCTQEGLSRFDGYSFTTYGIDDGLPGAFINDLIETNDGFYWIATNRGLVRFDPLGTRRPANGGRNDVHHVPSRGRSADARCVDAPAGPGGDRLGRHGRGTVQIEQPRGGPGHVRADRRRKPDQQHGRRSSRSALDRHRHRGLPTIRRWTTRAVHGPRRDTCERCECHPRRSAGPHLGRYALEWTRSVDRGSNAGASDGGRRVLGAERPSLQLDPRTLSKRGTAHSGRRLSAAWWRLSRRQNRTAIAFARSADRSV